MRRIFGAFFSALLLGLLALPQLADAAGFEVLHSFAGSDGETPKAGVILDASGNLYGTTCGDPSSCQSVAPGKHCAKSCGNTYAIRQGGDFQVVYTFGGKDGAYPDSRLLLRKSTLYGTASEGGAAGLGVVFKLKADGTEKVLHSFNGADGAHPRGGLIADASGNLYGTTVDGGTRRSGTVFEIAPDGTETVLHSFREFDGANPQAGLIADEQGNFYGTTEVGGAIGPGTVFKLAPDGKEKVLYSFGQRRNEGTDPVGGVVRDASGNLYGTTYLGGAYDFGTVFRLSPDGKLKQLHSFTGGSDGSYPQASLIADSKGNLYGTAFTGGCCSVGVTFEIASDGIFYLLHFFNRPADGAYPTELAMDQDGILYGTTEAGGKNDLGTIFKLTP